METINIIDMATNLGLVPVTVNNHNKTLMVLAVTGSLIQLTYRAIKAMYTSYVSGSIPKECLVALN